jgi:hypothetical protein
MTENAAEQLIPWTAENAFSAREKADYSSALRYCRLVVKREEASALCWRLAFGRRWPLACALEAAGVITFDLLTYSGSPARRIRMLRCWAANLRGDYPVSHPVLFLLHNQPSGIEISVMLSELADEAAELAGSGPPLDWEALERRFLDLVRHHARALARLAGDKESERWQHLLAACWLSRLWRRAALRYPAVDLWWPRSWLRWLGLDFRESCCWPAESRRSLLQLAGENTRRLFQQARRKIVGLNSPWLEQAVGRWLGGRARLHRVCEVGYVYAGLEREENIIQLSLSALHAGWRRLQGCLP